MSRREFTFTPLQVDKLNKVKQVLQELDEYKPLTLRQIYYQLVGKGYIPNKKSQYGMLSNLLKWARIKEYIDWDDIEDRVRVFEDLTGWGCKETYIRAATKSYLTSYTRNLLNNQSVYLECWIEKDALRSIFTKIASQYSVPVVVCRGFSSASFLNDFKDRVVLDGRKTIMFYFGDFDPSGMEMLSAMQTTLEEEMGLPGVEYKRIALFEEDIAKYKLPHNPDAIKKSDTRTEKHLLTYGDIAVELDALPPAVLEEKIREAIEAEIDMTTYLEEKGKEISDLNNISNLKSHIKTFIDSFQKKGGDKNP